MSGDARNARGRALEGRPKRGRGRPSRLSRLQASVDVDVDVLSAELLARASGGAASDVAPHLQVVGPRTTNADSLALPQGVARACLGKALPPLATHPLGKTISAFSAVHQEETFASTDEFKEVASFGAEFWCQEANMWNNAPLATFAAHIGKITRWVRRTERWLATAA